MVQIHTVELTAQLTFFNFYKITRTRGNDFFVKLSISTVITS